MNTKHTPGPWQLIRCDSGDITVTYTDGEIRSHVATCHHLALAPEHGELLNNARLIAAAPELLAACQATLDSLANMTSEDFSNGADRILRAALSDVIAKAEGTA